MKLLINQNPAIEDLEILINCTVIDDRVRSLMEYISQYSNSLLGMVDDMIMQIPLDTIFYIESVDRKTFFYDKQRVFRCGDSLVMLEPRLNNSFFTRISKNCMVNVSQISSTYPCPNHKMGIVLKNGERLIVGRTYVEKLRFMMKRFHMEKAARDSSLQVHSPDDIYCSLLNNNRILRFNKPPQRIIAITYYSAELLCALGLEDRIIGIVATKNEIGHLLPTYRERLMHIPLIQRANYQAPIGPELVELKPDFIFANYYYQSYLERMEENISEIALYISEGSIPGKASIESVYKDIFNLGKLFGVEDRALVLTEQLQNRIAKLPMNPFNKTLPTVFVYDSQKNKPITSGSETLENSLITLSGGKNIFSDHRSAYHSVSWSDVAERNPTFIIVHDYGDYISVKEKIAWLKTRPELTECVAVKENHFIAMSLSEVFPGVQNALAVENLFSTFHPELL